MSADISNHILYFGRHESGPETLALVAYPATLPIMMRDRGDDGPSAGSATEIDAREATVDGSG